MSKQKVSAEWHNSEDTTRAGPGQCGKASLSFKLLLTMVSSSGDPQVHIVLLLFSDVIGPSQCQTSAKKPRTVVTLGFRRTSLNIRAQAVESPGFIRRAEILSIALSLLVTMSHNPEASEASKLSPSAPSSPSSLEVDQSLPPTLHPSSETVSRDSKRNVDTDKLYSVFISRDKRLVVSLAAFAALFRQVETPYMF